MFKNWKKMCLLNLTVFDAIKWCTGHKFCFALLFFFKTLQMLKPKHLEYIHITFLDSFSLLQSKCCSHKNTSAWEPCVKVEPEFHFVWTPSGRVPSCHACTARERLRTCHFIGRSHSSRIFARGAKFGGHAHYLSCYLFLTINTRFVLRLLSCKRRDRYLGVRLKLTVVLNSCASSYFCRTLSLFPVIGHLLRATSISIRTSFVLPRRFLWVLRNTSFSHLPCLYASSPIAYFYPLSALGLLGRLLTNHTVACGRFPLDACCALIIIVKAGVVLTAPHTTSSSRNYDGSFSDYAQQELAREWD